MTTLRSFPATTPSVRSGRLGVLSNEARQRTPRLSVVTPVLNGAEFVSDCVESVATQECADCEHVIVDGGSTDGTIEVLDDYARTRANIRVFVRPGLRQSAAMNLGIAESRGNIIGILNIDDFYSEEVLPRIIGLFESLPDP